jgi:hypothetical protein
MLETVIMHLLAPPAYDTAAGKVFIIVRVQPVYPLANGGFLFFNRSGWCFFHTLLEKENYATELQSHSAFTTL